MQRFEIVVRKTGPDGAPSERRITVGRFGGWLGAVAVALVVVAAVGVALVIGWLIAGLLIAAFLVFVVAAVLRGALRSVRSRRFEVVRGPERPGPP